MNAIGNPPDCLAPAGFVVGALAFIVGGISTVISIVHESPGMILLSVLVTLLGIITFGGSFWIVPKKAPLSREMEMLSITRV